MKKQRNHKLIIFILSLFLLIGIGLYLFYNTRGNIEFALNLRGKRIPAFIIVGISTTVSTIIFQTITHNNILTPSIIGLDRLYVLFQTVIIFFFGSGHLLVTNTHLNFVVSSLMMIFASLILFYIFFKKYPGRIFLLLMTGLILGTFLDSFTTFLQTVIDPNEFDNILANTLASFNQIETSLIFITFLITIPILIYLFKESNTLDVFHLGENYSKSLGINVDRKYFILFILISILTAVTTALVGPITFLGFIGANLSYRIFKTYKHSILFIGGSLFTTVLVIFAQFLVEHLFNMQTNIGVVVEFTGGIYFLYLLLKERKQLR